jgi:hypothetical protein
VSDTKRVLTFGKSPPCHANILCRSDLGHRPNPRLANVCLSPRQLRECGRGQTPCLARAVTKSEGLSLLPPLSRSQLCCIADPKGAADNLNYSATGQEPQRADGLRHNRHLNYLTESVYLNAGGCPETDVPSSREEKPGQRRSRHSSRRSGKPATGRRAAGDCQHRSRD